MAEISGQLQIGMGWYPEQAGGLNRYYMDLRHNLVRHGETPRGLVAGSSPGPIDAEAGLISFANKEWSLLRRLRGVRHHARLLQAHSPPSLIVAHFALYALPVLDLFAAPLVVHFHGPWALEGEAQNASSIAVLAKKFVERRVYSKARAFIVLSRAFGDILINEYGVDAAKIHLVQGACDHERFRPQFPLAEARARLGWSDEGPILFCIRRLVPRMGIDVLIRAFRSIASRHPTVRLFIGGRGPLADSLQAQIASLGLESRIRLLGFVPDGDLPLAYQAADLSIVPTQSLEGFGLIAAESLACGTPCLVTPVGGLPELMGGLSSELVAASASEESLAKAMDSLIREPHLMPSREECAKYAQKYFHWTRATKEILDIYRLASKS